MTAHAKFDKLSALWQESGASAADIETAMLEVGGVRQLSDVPKSERNMLLVLMDDHFQAAETVRLRP